MNRNKAREQPSPDSTEMHTELVSDQLEEPPQRWGGEEASCLLRNEKIRLVALGLALLALLAGLLLHLLSGSVLPLFGTMVVAFLGYQRLDVWLDTTGRS